MNIADAPVAELADALDSESSVRKDLEVRLLLGALVLLQYDIIHSMKVIKKEDGIDLVPETEFEKECIKHIAGKTITAKFEDSWNRTGNLEIKFEAHKWDAWEK